MLDKVKHVILVLSGKGGVGKSTVSTQLALALRESGLKVGLLDIDLCGPSVPYLLGLEESDVYQCDEGWVPIYTGEDKTLAVMSIGFLLKNRNDPVIWRGPKKTMMIRQFLTDVKWDELDYLIIDTPPGTSDEHITVMECMRDVKCDGAIMVTTPQGVALDDVRKELTFCRKTGVHVLGIVENMSGFVCPKCSNCTNIFSSEGGAELAKRAGVPHLGTLPIDPRLNVLVGTTRSVLTELPESNTATIFKSIVEQITNHNSKSVDTN
uniref:Cytosolic Fe-S cluster assembly factor NUBP2 homolog n=1 Tax=Zeugodacus cucurbitae TaxID=28588 RepID=A0A0A1XFC9_ZEUCU